MNATEQQQAQPKLLTLDDIVERLKAVSIHNLYRSIEKTGKATAVVDIAGRRLPLHKVGKRWVCWSVDFDNLYDEPKPVEMKAKTASTPTTGFRFIDPSNSK